MSDLQLGALPEASSMTVCQWCGMPSRSVARLAESTEEVSVALGAVRRALATQERMIDDLIICSRHRDTQDSGTGTDRSALDPARQRAVSLLTPREREVLLLVSRGNSNRQVAASLCISEKTAKNHLSAIFAKLGASDRTQAVVLGIRGGIVSMSETREASPPTGGSGGWSASQC